MNTRDSMNGHPLTIALAASGSFLAAHAPLTPINLAMSIYLAACCAVHLGLFIWRWMDRLLP